MKKLIIFLVVLGMSGTASAGMVGIVSTANTDLGGDGPNLAQAGDVYNLAIHLPGNNDCDQYGFSITPVTTPSATATLGDTAGTVTQAAGGFAPLYSGIVANAIAEVADMSMGFWVGPLNLVSGFDITIGGTSGTVDVILGTTTASGYFTRTRTPAGTGPWQYPGMLYNLSASLPITVIPEPATMLLLGLGGLLLRRRK